MQEPRVLYTSGAVRREIRVLLRAPALDDRRVVVVAYIGKDVLSLLPLPDLSGLEIVCSPTPAGTMRIPRIVITHSSGS